jgi:hypothetical protein
VEIDPGVPGDVDPAVPDDVDPVNLSLKLKEV